MTIPTAGSRKKIVVVGKMTNVAGKKINVKEMTSVVDKKSNDGGRTRIVGKKNNGVGTRSNVGRTTIGADRKLKINAVKKLPVNNLISALPKTKAIISIGR